MDGGVGVTENGHQAAAALAVGAGPGLDLARRSVVRGMAGGAPGALVGDGAAGAGRVGRRADEGAELHDGDRPGGGGRLVLREYACGELTLGLVDRLRGELDAAERPGEDAAYVRVEDHVALAVGEGGDRRRGVVADARKRDQLVIRRRHLAAVVLDDRGGGRVQPQRPTGVAEAAPGAYGLAGRLRGEVGRGRPALHPGLVDGEYAGDRGLLKHELADHHRPRRRGRGAPGEVARVGVVPVQDGVVENCHTQIVPCDRYCHGVAPRNPGTGSLRCRLWPARERLEDGCRPRSTGAGGWRCSASSCS